MNQIKIIALLAFVTLSLNLQAQSKKNQDIKAIKSMCGCYEVGFNFSETFSYSSDSTYKPSPTKRTEALEWVVMVEDDENKISLQHVLIAGENNDHIVKHWRQDWLYENTDIYTYHMDNQWNFTKLNADEVHGQWTQKVFQVDDGPRYEGSASWVHIDGKSYWENTTDAPLPRREYTIREDYNVTKRRNRHEITPTGWLHNQDNDKIIRTASSETLLAQEKGLNTYEKVSNSKCQLAIDYWTKNEAYWQLVRNSWNQVYAIQKDFKLAEKVEGKPLFMHLYTPKDDATEEGLREAILKYFQTKG